MGSNVVLAGGCVIMAETKRNQPEDPEKAVLVGAAPAATWRKKILQKQ